MTDVLRCFKYPPGQVVVFQGTLRTPPTTIPQPTFVFVVERLPFLQIAYCLYIIYYSLVEYFFRNISSISHRLISKGSSSHTFLSLPLKFYCSFLLLKLSCERNASQRIINLLGTGESIMLHCQHILFLKLTQRNAMDLLSSTATLSKNSSTWRRFHMYFCSSN